MDCSASLQGDTRTPSKTLGSPEREEPFIGSAREDPQLCSNTVLAAFHLLPLCLCLFMSQGAGKMKRLLADFSPESPLGMVPHFQGSLPCAPSKVDPRGNAVIPLQLPRQANIIIHTLRHRKSVNLICFGEIQSWSEILLLLKNPIFWCIRPVPGCPSDLYSSHLNSCKTAPKNQGAAGTQGSSRASSATENPADIFLCERE